MFIHSTFTPIPRDRNAWNSFDLNGSMKPFNPTEGSPPMSPPMSPLTPLSQLLPLVQLEQTHDTSFASSPVVSTPAHLPILPGHNTVSATTSTAITSITSGFDPESPRNRHFDPPRSRDKNSRWTELQRGLARRAEQPSSLQALESEVRIVCLSCICYSFICVLLATEDVCGGRTPDKQRVYTC